MNTNDLIQVHKELCDKARGILEAKNHDYTASNNTDALANFRGAEFLGVPSELGLLIRVMDKMKRIESFVKFNTLKVKNEPVEDAVLDCINYFVLLYGLLQERKLNAEKDTIQKEIKTIAETVKNTSL